MCIVFLKVMWFEVNMLRYSKQVLVFYNLHFSRELLWLWMTR